MTSESYIVKGEIDKGFKKFSLIVILSPSKWVTFHVKFRWSRLKFGLL